MKGKRKSGFYVFLFLIFLLIGQDGFSQAISPLFFGQNSWMPDSTGTTALNGKVHQTWGIIKESGAQSIRFGGIASDRDKPTNFQYLKMIDSIRANGMEPIIQVSYWNGKYSAQQAAELVKFINVTNSRKIKYWSIGNEPDHSSTYGISNSSEVAPYIKSFSSAMKAEDSNIKIIGPDCAWYNKSIIYGLTTPGGPDDITGKNPAGHYYIDIISFHEYPFNGTQSREEVLSNITSDQKFESKLIDLKSRLNQCNNFHGRNSLNSLKMAVTESNINFKNSNSDHLQGSGATSFIGGQFWAELLSVAMKHEVEFINFWSVIEGNNTALNIGYLDRTTLSKQPTFYHFKLLADNFSGNYCNGKSNQGSVKVFGSKNGKQISVMILNQSLSENYSYAIKLNNDAISGSEAVKLNIDANLNKEYQDEISNQSTTLLVFNANGDLIRKCEYKLNGHANQGLTPECIEIAPPLTAAITAPSTNICGNKSVDLTAVTNQEATYQWKKDNHLIRDAVSKTYTVNTAGVYSVVVKNGPATTTSDPLEITASDIPSAIISYEGDLNICNASNVKLSVNAGNKCDYTWKLNSENISSSNQCDFIATVPGTYTVNVSNSCGSKSSDPVTITGCEAVTKSILNSEDGNNLVQSYPNPTKGNFTIEMKISDSIDQNITLEIINVVGQVVHRQIPNSVNGYIRHEVELDPSFPDGVYIIRITAGTQAYTNKIMIAR